MKTKPLVVLCWVQVTVAAVLVLLHFASMITRPATGMDSSRITGIVSDVASGSPAERVGIRAGDRIVSLNGHRPGRTVTPLYFARAGEPVPVVVERDGRVQELTIVPESGETLRRRALTEPGRVVTAVNAYLDVPLHLWMFGLAVTLLVLRPGNKDARLAAVSLSCWVGGMFMFRTSGLGALLRNVPEWLHGPLYVADALYAAGFFAANLHFALTFPTDRARVRRAWELVPYIAVLPIFIETLLHNLRRHAGDAGAVTLPWTYAYSTVGTLMLLAALVTLAVRFMRMQDVNARRRLKLIFLAMAPGSIAFILEFIASLAGRGNVVTALLHTPSMIVGSSIFVYAVVRHRMFNIRVLVRRSLQYAFARSTLLALMSLPVFGLAFFLWVHRDESLAVLLTGTPTVYVLVILPLVLVIRYRKRLLDSLDRRFFREQYDARRLLLHVVSIIRGGSDMLALSRAALDEIERALHPKHISLWQLDPEGAALHRGFASGQQGSATVEPLPANGTLATLLSTDDEALDVHSRHTRALFKRLPEAERTWLEVADAYLIVPLLIEKRLVGAMVLGERKSEEPYSREDRELLRMLGVQLALTLDYNRLKQSPSLVWSPASGSAPIHLHIGDTLQLCPRCGRCYAPDETRCEVDDETLVPESGVPRIIEEKYVVTRLLGRGGMGSVYQATQKRLNRPVAIKVLLSHLVGSTAMRTRFEREARIVARLRHPAIVTIHDFGLLPSGHAYLVMEYLDGDTLRKTIASGAHPVAPAVELLSTVGDAIDSAHRAGVIHRDLKPENIMLVNEQAKATPRVLDFGLAKMTGPIGEDDATLVQSGHSAGVVGTLMYMAPEVLSGHVADAASDQYSLALIAYELVSGVHPLGMATDLAAVVRGHTETPVVPIRELVDTVPPKTAGTIERALSKKPAERFASVGEFVAALRPDVL